MTRKALVQVTFPAVILFAAACAGPEAPHVAVPLSAPAVVVPASTASAAVAPPPDEPGARLRALVCGQREPCAFVKEHDAGKDAKGRTLSVALFFVGHEGDEPGGDGSEPAEGAGGAPEEGAPKKRSPAPHEAPVDPSVSFQPDGEVFSAHSYSTCMRYEYWRIVAEGALPLEADRIAEVCNDGHGAAGVGEDSVTIGPNSFEISTAGGSNWRWSESYRYSLSPFVQKTLHTGGHWSINVNGEENRLDWEAFSGSTRWYSPACDPDGAAPEPPEDQGSELEYIYVWLPQVSLDSTFLTSGWKTTRLDRCAASIDASGNAGFVLSGAASTAADARVRVLATEAALFVEVEDDKIIGPTGQPAQDDHLEVWVGPPLPSYQQHCIDPADTTGVLSWDVRIADGKVTAGSGKPAATSLVVERAADPGGAVRFRIVPPSKERALTIVYADNDGKKIERRIATSELKGGKMVTLGAASPVGAQASCSVKDGALVPELMPAKITNPQ